MRRFFVCHYHEIILKRGNRDFFERHLRQNAQLALKGLAYRGLRRLGGRLLVELLPDSPADEIQSRLLKLFGVVICCPAWWSKPDPESLQKNLWELVRSRRFETFKIHSRRADKSYPLKSMELNRLLGAHVLKLSGRRVQLDDPDLTCYVDVVKDGALLYFKKLRGPGGLPVSASGRVAVLLSGGIDSPVAAYKVIKRGCRAAFVHFHSLPHTTPESLDKVRRLVDVLNQYQFRSKLYLIPFAEVQRQIVAYTPVETRVIMYRRMMVRLAERVARRERARALVTGDSIGQVSSQTLENLQAISDAAGLPLFRPLIGDDKEEIVALARRIGTFPISTLPDVDCCSLFVPRHPEIRARLDGIRRIEADLDIEAMIDPAWEAREVEKPGFQQPARAGRI